MKFKKLFSMLICLMMVISMVACNSGVTPTEVPTEAPTETPEEVETPEPQEEVTLAKDGVYSTSAQGRNGMVYVDTTIKNGVITDVKVTKSMETDVFTTEAIPALAAAIVNNNSYGVDAISGATWTSYAIKTAVASAIREAGGTASYYSVVPTVEKGSDETVDADVVVIGAGISGIMAATKAGADGAKVVLLEKTGIVGGCSLQSFGAAHYEGEETIKERFIGWVQDQHYMLDTTLLHAYLDNNDPALSFIRTYNESYDFFPNAPDNYLLVTYMNRPPIYQEMLNKEVIDNGGNVYLETTAKSLIVESGVVTGVVAERKDGSTLTIKAKAVIIATGGFGGNLEMVREYSGYDVVCGCLTQDVGEGLQMAWDVGAAVPNNLGGLQLHQTLATANLVDFDYFHMRMPMILCYSPSLLNVTKNGVRFRNEEWVNVATAASTGGSFVGGTTYVLIDQSTIDKLEDGGLLAMGTDISPSMPPEYKPNFTVETPWTDAKEVFDAMVEGGWGYYGETIEDLAKAAGFDVATFTETFNTYQSYCQNGADPLFNKDPKYLVEYEQGPYYLVETTYNQLGTTTGLIINAKTQVLDSDGKAIEGLYSVGADASSTLYDHNYYGKGDAIGWAITSGYMGGESAAAYALGK